MRARSTQRSSKSSRRAEIAPAISSATQVVCVRSTGRGLQTRGPCQRSLYKECISLIYPSKFIAERGRSSRWRAAPTMFNRGSSGSLISTEKRRSTFWNCLPKSASVFHTTICQLSSSYKDRSGLENKTTIRRPLARLGMTRIAICTASSTSGPDFSVVRRSGGKRRDEEVEHGQDAGTAPREMFYDCSLKTLRAAHREMETVKVRLD